MTFVVRYSRSGLRGLADFSGTSDLFDRIEGRILIKYARYLFW
jgi:hypothetical protein